MKKKSPMTKKVSKKIKKSAVKRKKKVSAIPKGYNVVTPYLIIDGAAKAIDFYKKAFAAKVVMRMEHGGKVGHAELRIGDAKIMLADEWADMGAYGPKKFGGSPMSLHLYVKNADSVIDKAVALGAKLTRAVENMFYGDRSGMVEDPFGYKWTVSTHIEDVTPAKLKKRAEEKFGK